MDGSAFATSALLPLIGALASLAALPMLGLESLRAAGREPAPVVAHGDGVVLARAAAAPIDASLDDGRLLLRLSAVRVDDGHEVASARADEPFTSVAARDALIAAAALGTLRPEYRFRTFYAARGRVTDETLWGDLVVGGRGDPTVDAIRLRDVANKLAQGGIGRITGAVLLDDSFFRAGGADELLGVDEEGEPVPLEGDESDAGTVVDTGPTPVDTPSQPASIRAFPFAGNRLDLVVRPTRLGAPAVVEPDPRTPFVIVESLVKTSPFARRLRAFALPEGERALVVVTGAVAPDDAPRALSIELPDGAYALGHTLTDELRRRGVRVSGRVEAVDASGPRRWLLTDFSPPLSDVLGAMLRRADRGPPGTTREAVLRVVAAESQAKTGVAESASTIVKRFFERDLALDVAALTIDPSKTTTTARLAARALAGAHRSFAVKSELEIALGQASLHPQLRHGLDERFWRRTRAAAIIDDTRAELAGFVGRDDGSVLAFTLAIDAKEPLSVDVMWRAVNRALAALVEQEVSLPAPKAGAAPNAKRFAPRAARGGADPTLKIPAPGAP